MNEIIRIRVDDYLYMISKSTINKFPESHMYTVLYNGDKSDIIHKDGNTLYIDISPENMQNIISYMRGYKLSSMNDSLHNDFEKLGVSLPEHIISDIDNNKVDVSESKNSIKIIRPKRRNL